MSSDGSGERVRMVMPGPRLVGLRVPDHPDHPINFCKRRKGGTWWFGHNCDGSCASRTRASWATGSWGYPIQVLEGKP
jgi:hypothetical protein